MIFRRITDEEVSAYKQWARDNYEKFSPIPGIWHPIVQAECVAMNAETGYANHYAEEAANRAIKQILSS